MSENAHNILFGEKLDVFYRLGEEHVTRKNFLKSHLGMLKQYSKLMNITLKLSVAGASRYFSFFNESDLRSMKAYSSALEIPQNDLMSFYLSLELLTCSEYTKPNLLGLLPGCSSLFVKEDQSVSHYRVLDFSALSSYQWDESVVSYQTEHDENHHVYSILHSGLPFAGHTCMNSKGLTIALHYKQHKDLNIQGKSIFSIVTYIIEQFGDCRQALKYLKTVESIGNWGLYLSDSSGNVLEVDLFGKEIYFRKFDIQDHHFLYFNNKSINNFKIEHTLAHFKNFCQARQEYVTRNIDISNIEHLFSQYHCRADNLLTPSSHGVYKLQSSDHSITIYPGFKDDNKEIKTQVFFNQKTIETTDFPLKIDPSFTHLSKAQYFYDMVDMTASFHHIQMALDLCTHPETLETLKLFKQLFHYSITSDKREYAMIYEDLKNLNNLAPNFENHRILHIQRLEKILNLPETTHINQISNDSIKRIYSYEKKLRPFLFQYLKKLTFFRFDWFDIAYTY